MLVRTHESDGVKLKMWEKVMMPESKMDETTKKFVKTGGPAIEMTKYTFRDITGDVLELTSKENNYRSLEGETVVLTLDITLDNFKHVVRTKLARVDKVVVA